jgi:hypothetical protein
MIDYQPLKIVANDREDLDIILTLLQDALMPTVSIVFDKEQKTMTFLTNRFCWEIPEKEQDAYYRVHSGLLFCNVESVHEKNIDQTNKKRILSFLTAKVEDVDSRIHIYLFFSDDACMRMIVSNVKCIMADIDEPWSTQTVPDHFPKKDLSSGKALLS